MGTTKILIALFIMTSCARGSINSSVSQPMLVIGDSISILYMPFITAPYQVFHNKENAEDSGFGVKHIQEWLDVRDHWSVCTFNHGLWDAYDTINTPTNDYVSNLSIEISLMRKKCDHILFITTTKVADSFVSQMGPRAVQYNIVAKKLMNEQNIPVCDIFGNNDDYAVDSTGHIAYHFTDQGSKLIADAITKCIEEDFNGH